jgi:diguanylate cyclase (GGDEF)-like protein
MHSNDKSSTVLVQEKWEVDKLRNEYDNLLRQVAFINDLTSTLLSNRDIEEMLEKIALGLHEKMDIDRVGIFCLNESSRTLECRYSAGIDSNTLSRMEFPIDSVEEMLAETAATKKPFFPHDQQKRLTKKIYEACQEEEREALAFPLYVYRGEGCLQNRFRDTMSVPKISEEEEQSKHGEEAFTISKDCLLCRFSPIFGILWMDNKSSGKTFNHELITIYTLLLNMDVAMENKFLIKELQDVSLKDPLTGAYNRLYFLSALEKEIERASRMDGKVSLSIIDLDNFKSINDQHGHQFGDRFLLQFCRLIHKSIRKMDYFCRYGGDEFVFILPEASAQQAKLVMQRIIKKIKEEGICVDGKQLEIKLSCGIASFPRHSREAKNLIELSDKALYQAKKLGKGRIELFHPSLR